MCGHDPTHSLPDRSRGGLRRRAAVRPVEEARRACRAGRAVHHRRGDHPRDARRDGAGARHLEGTGAPVPRAHRHLREDAQRDDRREPARDRGGRGARRRARPEEDPRPAARDPGGAQGQHPHDRDADHRRRAGLRRVRAALRGDAHEEPARRRRDHHRQDGHDRARQLGGDRHAHQLQRGRRLRDEPVRPAARPAGDRRRPAGPADRRVELGHRHRGQLLGGQRRHRDVGVDPQPLEPEHAGRHQADRRPHQPLRRHPDHGRPGHAGADGAHGDRRGDHARRARRGRARPERRGDQDVHAAAGARLHALPEPGRPEGRAHRHPARLVLRARHAARRDAAARRAEPRAGQGDGRGDRDPEAAGRDRRRSGRHPERGGEGGRRTTSCSGRPAAASTARRGRTPTARSSSSTG